MSDKYDNGYNSSDFKRNSNQDMKGDEEDHDDHVQDGVDSSKKKDKAGDYMRELLSEKIKLSSQKFPISCKLIDSEVAKVQAIGRIPFKDSRYLDVFREKPAKVTVKVIVPTKEHPKFNFVGKLLGPRGNNMKQLQEETMCKMAVLGRGSMRDRQKEEELRNSLDPKYAHLSDELHVEITALAPPAEAHARIAYALAEVKKYLIPDPVDMMRPPMRELMERDGGMRRPGPGAPEGVLYSACKVTKHSLSYQDPVLAGLPRPGPPRPGPPGRGLPGRGPPGRGLPRIAGPSMGRPMPGKNKVISILDRARNAMETSYGYDDPYAPELPYESQHSQQGYSTHTPRGPRSAPDPDFYYERPTERFYEDDYYKEPSEYKASAREVGTRRAGAPGGPTRVPHHYGRADPYARLPK